MMLVSQSVKMTLITIEFFYVLKSNAVNMRESFSASKSHYDFILVFHSTLMLPEYLLSYRIYRSRIFLKCLSSDIQFHAMTSAANPRVSADWHCSV